MAGSGRPNGITRRSRRSSAPANVRSPAPREYLSDGTAGRGLEGQADAVVLPGSTEEVAAVVAHCYADDIADHARAAAGPGSPAAPCRRAGSSSARGGWHACGRSIRSSGASTSRPAFPTGELRRIARGSGLLVPAGSRRRRAVADRRQRGDERGRPARVQVRHDAGVGDGDRGRDPAGRDRDRRRAGAEERGRVRPRRPAHRLGGHARDRDRGLAAAHPRGRGRASDRRALPRRGGRLRGRRGADGKRCRPRVHRVRRRAGPGDATAHDFPGGAPGRGFLVIAEADGSAAEAAAGRGALREALAGAGATWIGGARRRRHPRALAVARLDLASRHRRPRRQARRGHRRPGRPAGRRHPRIGRDRRAGTVSRR